SSAVWSSDHSDVTSGHPEHLRQRTMHVMWRLGGAPKSQLFVRIEIRDRGVLFERQVRVAFVEKNIFTKQVRFSETLFDIAEFERDFLMNIAAIAVLMDTRQIGGQSVFDRGYGFKPLILDLNQVHRIERRVFVDSGDCGNRIADETNFIDAQSVFVLAHRKNAVRYRKVLSGYYGYNAREFLVR